MSMLIFGSFFPSLGGSEEIQSQIELTNVIYHWFLIAVEAIGGPDVS